MSEQNKAIARRFFEGQDKQKGPLPADVTAPNYTARIGSMPPMNLEGHNHFGSAFYTAFPDLKHNIDDLVAEGDQVAVRFHLTGTNKSNFMGIPASNRSISVQAIAMMRFSNGKVVELNGVFDQIGLMQQIGAMPGH